MSGIKSRSKPQNLSFGIHTLSVTLQSVLEMGGLMEVLIFLSLHLLCTSNGYCEWNAPAGQ